MFYTYAEKQGNIFFDGWQMREIAFDTLRRYLYYSEYVSPEKVAYPNANDNPLVIADPSSDSLGNTEDAIASLGVAGGNPSIAHLTKRPPVSPLHQQRRFNEVPPPPSNPEDVRWRKKIKVDLIVPVGKEHEFLLGDTHLKETDLFQIEIHGETRPLVSGEMPPPGPLLCPSAGLSGMPGRCTVENDEFICDPFFLRELYESLRDQFSNLRMEREFSEMARGQPVLPANVRKTQTLESPRLKNGSVYRGSRTSMVFRMRNDYEFRRFLYVVQTVLGYDKLSVRPYRGLPPYDPRNGVIFAMIPMCVWHTFKLLDKTVFYTFLRGDVVGRNSRNELYVALRGAYLCITHDTVLVMRNTGNIPRWIKLPQVREFHYSALSSHPFVAFIADPGAPDIIFLPQPPIFGSDAIRRFSPSLEVLRMRHVMHETCFASLEIRRVINIQEIPELSVRGFVARYEQQTRRPIEFEPSPGYTGVLSCPLPKEQLAQVWREVQDIYAARDPTVTSRAAIPLYLNNANDTELTRDQLETLSRRLARERSSRDDIVGLPYEEAYRIQAPPRREGGLHHRRHTVSSHTEARERTQAHGDVAGLHVESSPAHTHAGGRSGESLPATSGDHRRSSAATAEEMEPSSRRRSAERGASLIGGAAGVPAHDITATARTLPGFSTVPDAPSAGNPFSATLAENSAGGNMRRLSESAVSDSPCPPPPSGVGGAAFSHMRMERAQLPSDRLETPQLSSSPGAGAQGFSQSVLMGTSPGLIDNSFCSTQFGGNSVQYQLPGARYLSADELKGAGSCVAVDHHTILMCETPESVGGASHPLLANPEPNVSEIVSRSITAMQATAGLSKKLFDSAERLTETRRGSVDTATPASVSSPTMRLELPHSKGIKQSGSSVET
ncbi:hypothetical protein JKF63_03966 [Porcisia hertigi]|uniref:Uncharacterized protein n=1 Tax=Porcisia hertigi TaxID=2761500 RepID=A0A836I6M1_9TRYP|nr:hypothetical protein JKF63_03966 [Porcisia hertigi]